MRVPIFAIFCYVFLVLEISLRRANMDGAMPNLMLILLVFVGMYAPFKVVLWSGMAIGILVDLAYAQNVAEPVHTAAIVGPNALAYLLGGYTSVKLRTMVFRDSPITLAVMVLVVGIVVYLTAVLLLRIRGFIGFSDPIRHFSASGELVTAFVEIIYSAVLAVPIGFLLGQFTGILGFGSGGKKR